MSYIGNAIPSATTLGGPLDVNTNKIVSNSNGDIDLEPHGTGNVLLGNLKFNADQTVSASEDDYVLTYDNSAGTIGLEAAAGGSLSGALLTITAATHPSDPSVGECYIYSSGTSGSSGTGIIIHASNFTSQPLEVEMGSSGTTLLRVTNQGGLQMAGEVEGSYFHDSGSGFYNLDPGSTTSSLEIAGRIELKGTSKDIRWYEGSNYVGFQGPATLSADQIWVLPAVDGAADEFLKTDGSGNLSWGAASGGGGSTGNFTFSTNTMQTNDGDFNLKVDADDNLGGYANFYFKSGDSGAGYHRFWIGWNNGEVAHKWTNTNQYSVMWQRTGNFWLYLNEHGGNHPVNISNVGSGSSADINLGTKTNGRVGVSEEYGTPFYQFPRAAPTSAGQQLTADNTSGDLSWAAASSDIRLKKNIEDNTLGLDFINDLNTVKFNWKTFKEVKESSPELSHYKPDERNQTEDDLILPKPGMQLSLIAQELKEVLSKHDHEDFKGHTTDVHDVQEVNREELIMPLIKAVQELSKRVEELEKE